MKRWELFPDRFYRLDRAEPSRSEDTVHGTKHILPGKTVRTPKEEMMLVVVVVVIGIGAQFSKTASGTGLLHGAPGKGLSALCHCVDGALSVCIAQRCFFERRDLQRPHIFAGSYESHHGFDELPIFGYRKLAYMLIVTAPASACAFVVGLMSASEFPILLTVVCVFIMNCAISCSETLTDGLFTDTMLQKPEAGFELHE